MAPKRNRRAPERRRRHSKPERSDDQLLRRPSAARFHCDHVVGDHARGFHRGLAELGIAGDLALHALAFGMQQVAQAFEFGDQVFDFRKRGAGDALDQRVDVVDGGFGARLQRRARCCSACPAPDGADRRRRCGRNRGCRPRLPRPRRDCSSTSVDSIFSERDDIHRLFPCFALSERGCPPHDESKVTPSGPPILTASRPICGNARSFTGIGGGRVRSNAQLQVYQLCLNPAVRLLFAAPAAFRRSSPKC